MSTDPHAELQAVRARLTLMQENWQRLYDATSESGPLTTLADHAWAHDSNMVWPAMKIASGAFHAQPHPNDVAGRLHRLCAVTPAGTAAKAAAILALDEVANWCDLRNDSCELMHSLLRAVAGIQSHGPGDGL